MFHDVRRWFFRLTDLLACTSLILMLLLIFTSVILRYVFNHPLLYSDEYAGYLFLFSFMLGLLPAATDGSNIRVEMLVHRLKGIGLKIFRGVDFVLILSYAILLLTVAATFTFDSYERGTRTPTAMETPIYLPAIIMPVGLFLLVVGVVINLFKTEASKEGDGK